MKATAAIFLLFFVVAMPVIARAHAYVVDAQPAMNGSYESPGGVVAITFDEPVDVLDSSAIVVQTASGTRIDKRDAHVDSQNATRVVVSVPQNLQADAYTVRWRVISADTHVVHGSYLIGVGTAVSTSTVTESATPFDPSAPAASTLRLAMLLCLTLAIGAISLAIIEPAASGPSRHACLTSCFCMIVIALPAMYVQSAAASGSALGAIHEIGSTLARTTWGHAILLRIAGASIIIALAFGLRRTRWELLCVLPALLCAASFSVAGHALMVRGRLQPGLSETMDLAHLCAVGVWLGTVIVIAFAARPRAAAIVPLFAKFTPIAIVAVILTIVTGTYAAIVHVQHLAAFTTTLYGQILTLKIVLVAAVLGVSSRQFQIGCNAAASTSNTAAFEAVLGVCVIVCTAIMIGQMPPMTMPGM